MIAKHKIFNWFKQLFNKPQPIGAKRPARYSKKAWFYRAKGQPTVAQQLFFKIGGCV